MRRAERVGASAADLAGVHVERAGGAGSSRHSDAGRLAADPAAVHLIELPPRAATHAQWPQWLDPDVLCAYRGRGIDQPWAHQVRAAELSWSGQHVGLVTGTASGKSAAYGMPGLTHALSHPNQVGMRGATVLYLAPTKALAQDQLSGLLSLGLPGLRAGTYDGDTPAELRSWVRGNARWVISNPDMLHRSMLPDHERWRGFLRGLALVVIDESHSYRGVFGAHVGLVLRRLLRIAGHYGAHPAVMATSATIADPQDRLAALVGAPVNVVDEDTSQRAGVTVVLWQPREVDDSGQRRGALTESALIASELIAAGCQTLVFARSRRGAEAIAGSLRGEGRKLGEVAAYRGGFLPEERRDLEARLRDGTLRGIAATNALELGIDISGLDAVVMAGWPGSRASFLQQAGRAGRRGRPATAVLVAREDPLDQYLITNPQAITSGRSETASFDVTNPFVLAPHLAAATAELPLQELEVDEVFGPTAPDILVDLAARGLVRKRSNGWFWTCRTRASELTDLRGAGDVVRIVEANTGRMLGTVDFSSALTQTHEGAVYTHQGQTHVITELDLQERVALAVQAVVDYDTSARQQTQTRLIASQASLQMAGIELHTGTVEVISQVTSYLKRRWPSGEVLGQFPLDLPAMRLPTVGTWWVISTQLLDDLGIPPSDVPGTLHAAEHAAIGMLPLIATCDRWDIGGSSIASHPQTEAPTVVIYDGAPGGAGFAATGYRRAADWLSSTAAVVRACNCPTGCPGCIQSPKCGSGNTPLDKGGAVRLLTEIARVLAC